MSDKKNRERFSIKFNENDPSHKTVIDLLEQQGPHRKAQFIVNAVLHYVHCTETPDLTIAPAVDKAYLESVILDILSRNKNEAQEIAKPVSPQPVKKEEPRVYYKDMEAEGNTEIAEDATLSLISATLSAFRNT